MKMKRITRLAAAAALLVITPALAFGAQFAVVGPRALGMGGASVAAVNDSTAVYWNPAALAQFGKVDIRIPAGAGLSDHVGLKDTWDRIHDIDALVQSLDPAALAELSSLLTGLDKPKTGADLDASAGLFVSLPVAESAIAISALSLGYAGLYPTIDTANLNTSTTLPIPSDSIVNNASAITAISIIATEPALSLSSPLGDKVFIGANAKMIYANTYVNSDSIRTSDFNSFKNHLTESKTSSSAASFDVGVIFAPLKSLNIGVVGRDLNSPSFSVAGMFATRDGSGNVTIGPGESEIKLDPQYRAGLAWKPLETLTIAADYDLKKNKTFTPGFEDQTAAVGLEKTFLAEVVSIRAGAYKNLAESDANNVYTAGLGIRIFAFRFDLAGAYDFKSREGQASVDLALRF